MDGPGGLDTSGFLSLSSRVGLSSLSAWICGPNYPEYKSNLLGVAVANMGASGFSGSGGWGRLSSGWG